MTSGDGRQIEASDVWPPAVEHPAGSAPATAPDTEQRELRRGRFALLSALTGIGLAALVIAIGLTAIQTGWVRSVPQAEGVQLTTALQVVYLIGLICEAVAIIAGIIARRTQAGRWGLAIALLMLITSFLWVFGLIVGVVFPDHNEWPWAGGDGDNCCHERMQ